MGYVLQKLLQGNIRVCSAPYVLAPPARANSLPGLAGNSIHNDGRHHQERRELANPDTGGLPWTPQSPVKLYQATEHSGWKSKDSHLRGGSDQKEAVNANGYRRWHQPPKDHVPSMVNLLGCLRILCPRSLYLRALTRIPIVLYYQLHWPGLHPSKYHGGPGGGPIWAGASEPARKSSQCLWPQLDRPRHVQTSALHAAPKCSDQPSTCPTKIRKCWVTSACLQTP